MKRLRIPVLAVAIIALVGAPASQAKKHSRIVGVSATAPPGATQVSLEPMCPPKTRAVGGGYASWGVGIGVGSGPPITASLEAVYESQRSSERTWRTSAIVVKNPAISNAPDPTPLSAWSYCKRLRGKIGTATSTGGVSTSAGSPSVARASCGRGKVAIAGGFNTSPLPGPGIAYPSIYQSFRSGQHAWIASAVPGTQASVTVTSYAYCARGLPAPVKRQHTKAQTGIVTSDPCPKGLHAGAGGFRTSAGGGAGLFQATLDTPGRMPSGPVSPVGDTWTMSAVSPDGGPITVLAYCS